MLRPSFRAASRAALEKLAGDAGRRGARRHRGDRRLPRRRRAARATPRPSCSAARSWRRYFKHHLPNYGVFDERRYFAPGRLARRRPASAASTSRSPSARTSGRTAARSRWPARPASGWSSTSTPRRTSATRTTCGCRCCSAAPREAGAPIVVREHGRRPGRAGLRRRLDGGRGRTARVLMRAPQFVEGLLPRPTSRSPTAVDRAGRGAGAGDDGAAGRRPASTAPRRSRRAAAEPSASPTRMPRRGRGLGALVTGLRDYVRKNGFRSVVLGVSGGIDSAVVAAIAADAIGGDERPRRVAAELVLVATTRAPTPRTSPRGSARTTGSRADRADGRRVRRRAAPHRRSPRRTCRRASAAPR